MEAEETMNPKTWGFYLVDGGDHGNQYTVEVATSEPQKLAEPYTIEVVAEETGVSPDTVHIFSKV